ncbi:MAG: REP element-mobilizing transposase RayT [Akkermansiaceae bacterium]
MNEVRQKQEEKRELTDLEKADCLTGKMPGGIALKAPGRGTGKRRRFVFDDRTCCYHVLSRITGGDLLLGDVEKEAFRKLMRRMERHSGVEVLTYAILGNHFHLLVRVPEREKFLAKFEKGSKEAREARLLEHLKLLYSRAYLKQLEAELGVMKEKGLDELYEKTISGYLDRLCSLKHFMKELKERFSRWFNKRHGRQGTLWQERYRSILVEDGEALRTISAYIDLNPVRAGLVDDPKDYRWCGYAEAMGGSKRGRVGICRVLGVAMDSWNKGGLEAYRSLLLGEGIEAGEAEKNRKRGQGVFLKRGFDRKKALEGLRGGGSLSRGELVRLRVRYFSEGLVLGSRAFVEEAFQERRAWFGAKRKKGAHGLPVLDGELYSLRNVTV